MIKKWSTRRSSQSFFERSILQNAKCHYGALSWRGFRYALRPSQNRVVQGIAWKKYPSLVKIRRGRFKDKSTKIDKREDVVNEESVVPVSRIESIILIIRRKRVILDHDLAELYGVTTGNLNKAVRRNIDRFPHDFMFQLTKEEYEAVRFQFGILEKGRHSKYLPNAFTEQGVAMLSSVLRSKRAVQVNIEIMRAFVRLRQLISASEVLEKRLDALEDKYDSQFKVVFDAIRGLMMEPKKSKRKIGFEVKEPKVRYGKK